MSRHVRPALLLLVAAVFIAATLLGGCSAGPKVPDVTGMNAADATRALQDAGYKLGDTRRMYTPGIAPGIVWSQSPAAGTRLKEGEAVSITVALPLGEFTVPDVSGKTAEEASTTIASASLTPAQIDQYSDTAPAGTVFGQVPDPGAKVNLGAKVYYLLSMGPAPSTSKVPNVDGKTQSDAEKAIKDAGLKPAAEKVYSDTVAAGKVIAQSPAAGTVVTPGTTVTFAVSLGKPTSAVTVPVVTGQSESAARSTLQAAGLAVDVFYQPSSTVAKGIVIEQMPPGNTKTAPGGTVGIVVSSGPDAMVTVPEVGGKTSADAAQVLAAAGLGVTETEQPSADVAKGSVISQLPVAGSKVPAGSVVVIAVSTGVPEE